MVPSGTSVGAGTCMRGLKGTPMESFCGPAMVMSLTGVPAEVGVLALLFLWDSRRGWAYSVILFPLS